MIAFPWICPKSGGRRPGFSEFSACAIPPHYKIAFNGSVNNFQQEALGNTFAGRLSESEHRVSGPVLMTRNDDRLKKV
jgi:hypothetical protein